MGLASKDKGIVDIMELIYKRATINDIELLTETRIESLKAADRISSPVDLDTLSDASKEYYKRALADDTHVAYLIFDGTKFIASGGICFYDVMPTYSDCTGKRAYIMNMYTKPDYRRQGIAYKTLSLLVGAAYERGVNYISLEPTDISKHLYEKYGFRFIDDEMRLVEF